MNSILASALRKKQNIIESGKTIYDPIAMGDHEYWLTSSEFTELLNHELRGNCSLNGLPLRTRSKRMKELVCATLGYPVPTVFAKAQPRFTGQMFDTYGQKANNLQVWNEELYPERRYVLIKLSESDVIECVK